MRTLNPNTVSMGPTEEEYIEKDVSRGIDLGSVSLRPLPYTSVWRWEAPLLRFARRMSNRGSGRMDVSSAHTSRQLL